MCCKIRRDGESEKFCNFFWELNKTIVEKKVHGNNLVQAKYKNANEDGLKCMPLTSSKSSCGFRG